MLSLISLSGCVSAPVKSNVPLSGNVQRLMKHPQMELARKLTPELQRDELKTINSLESVVEKQQKLK